MSSNFKLKIIFINFFIYIEVELISIIMMSNLKFIDLFAGCGGLSLGLEQAGFHPVYVNELNTDALNTYLINRTDYKYLGLKEFHSKNIKELTNSKKKTRSTFKKFKKKI